MPKHKSGIMGMSHIPYAQRLEMKQRGDINANREHSARVVMYCYSVALHDVEGIGYLRICRFAQHFMEIDHEFYADGPEVGMAKAQRRMEDIGMPIGDNLFAYTGKCDTVRQQQVKDNAMAAAHGALVCGAIALNDVFGFGPVIQDRVSNRVSELTTRYAKEGDGFLLDELGKMGFTIKNGRAYATIDDSGNPIKQKPIPR